jgi:hypothetical protein
MGAPGYENVVQTDFSYSSTKSIFEMRVANKIAMTITFLSPVTPVDLMRQSLVFSYLDVAVRSIDGKQHDVQLYSDISAGKPTKRHDLISLMLSRMGFWRARCCR